MNDRLNRYSRQILFVPIGSAGQQRLGDSRVAIVGCGALGSVLAEMLVRSGIGYLTLIDRDLLDWSNLHRQSLYGEEDVQKKLPKAAAAAAHLRALNSDVHVEGIVADVQPDNILKLVSHHQVILDGTDNFDTRFLVNEAAIQLGIPWIYGACVASCGMSATFLTGGRPCFRCLMQDMDLQAGFPTCDTAGIIAPVVHWVASVQASEVIKLLLGLKNQLHGSLLVWDAWSYAFQRIRWSPSCASGCEVCRGRRFPLLDESAGTTATLLCGRNAVLIRVPGRLQIDLEELEQRLSPVGCVTRNEYLLQAEIEGLEMVIFSDGRGMIKGTSDLTLARSLYARFVGH